MAGSASLKLPSRHIQNDAKRGPVLHQAQLQTPRPAGLDINSLRIRSAVRQQPTHPPISTMVSLTPNTCSRLRDRGDSDVLSSEPTVRVLVLKDVRPDDAPEGIRRMAFITDGEDFTFVALSQTSGDPDGWMYPGAAIRLTSVHRLPDGFTWSVSLAFPRTFATTVY
ncbi:hypothetical protein C8Q70DRAFT_149605 [Cubamyces menziesii]|nr:hypothetical protein C8Q70DRAFT_149605 [Cubamyces menziesii]